MTSDQERTAAPYDELCGYRFEDLYVGQSDVFSKTITEADVVMFAGVSGDTNPMHLNEAFAAQARFETRVAHGMLTASLISTIIGTRLPGPGCIYLRQNLKFVAPVRIGETVTARLTVERLRPQAHWVDIKTVCHAGDTLVVDGDGLLWVPPRGSS